MYHAEVNSGRITVRSVVLNFADLWGFGSRSIFNVIGHLLWRPGYMIADYLNGKQSRYLQPVKTLIVMTLFLIQIAWLTDTKMPVWEDYQPKVENALVDIPDSDSKASITRFVSGYDAYRHWCDDHRAFGMLTGSLACILMTWLLFRRSPRPNGEGYNLAEVTTAFLYILCQLQLVTILAMIVTWGFKVNDSSTVFLLPYTIIFVLFFVDFKQLFGRSWWGTLWRTFLIFTWLA